MKQAFFTKYLTLTSHEVIMTTLSATFMQNTSAHGFGNLMNADDRRRKTFWASLCASKFFLHHYHSFIVKTKKTQNFD